MNKSTDTNITELYDRKYLIIYLLLVFSLSWTIWILSGVLFRQDDFRYDSQWLIAQIGVFVPTGIALVMSGIKRPEIIKKNVLIFILALVVFMAGFAIIQSKPSLITGFNRSVSWIIVAIAVFSIMLIHISGYYYFPNLNKNPARKSEFYWSALSVLFLPILFLIAWSIISISSGVVQVTIADNGLDKLIWLLIVIFAMNFILGGSMGEEFGWRGYVLPALLKKYNPAGASLILGLIWTVWHLPIDITSQVDAAPFVIIFRLIWTLPLTIIFTWFYLKTDGNILIALFLHTSVNILPDLGFSNYQSALFLMTLFIIIISGIIVTRPEMRVMIHFKNRVTGGK